MMRKTAKCQFKRRKKCEKIYISRKNNLVILCFMILHLSRIAFILISLGWTVYGSLTVEPMSHFDSARKRGTAVLRELKREAADYEWNWCSDRRWRRLRATPSIPVRKWDLMPSLINLMVCLMNSAPRNVSQTIILTSAHQRNYLNVSMEAI